jgi:hypothetical protein
MPTESDLLVDPGSFPAQGEGNSGVDLSGSREKRALAMCDIIPANLRICSHLQLQFRVPPICHRPKSRESGNASALVIPFHYTTLVPEPYGEDNLEPVVA